MKRGLLLSFLLLASCSSAASSSAESFESHLPSSDLGILSSENSSYDETRYIYKEKINLFQHEESFDFHDNLMDEIDLLATYGEELSLKIYSQNSDEEEKTPVSIHFYKYDDPEKVGYTEEFNPLHYKEVIDKELEDVEFYQGYTHKYFTTLTLSIYDEHYFIINYVFSDGRSGRIYYFGKNYTFELYAKEDVTPVMLDKWSPNFRYNLYEIQNENEVPSKWRLDYGINGYALDKETFSKNAYEYYNGDNKWPSQLKYNYIYFDIRANVDNSWYDIQYRVNDNSPVIDHNFALDSNEGYFFALHLYHYPYIYVGKK